MNREKYIEYIITRLSALIVQVKLKASNNILDLNIYSETFFAELFNLIFDYNLINSNVQKQNTTSYDLLDEQNHILIQVSSTASKNKITSSLSHNILADYPQYRFKFIFLVEDAKNLTKHTYITPDAINFDPAKDIYALQDILRYIIALDINKIEKIHNLIKKELGDPNDIIKFDSNIVKIITELAGKCNDDDSAPNLNDFDIQEKIDINNLQGVQEDINEYKIYYNRLDDKYAEYDRQGANKNNSIYKFIKHEFGKLCQKNINETELYYLLIETIVEFVQKSVELSLPYEEILVCVKVIIVDAFIRCKIFKNPKGEYSHVTPR